MNSLKGQAESQTDSDQQKKLLAAAKMLADATARMVEAAKVRIKIRIRTRGLYSNQRDHIINFFNDISYGLG